MREVPRAIGLIRTVTSVSGLRGRNVSGKGRSVGTKGFEYNG